MQYGQNTIENFNHPFFVENVVIRTIFNDVFPSEYFALQSRGNEKSLPLLMKFSKNTYIADINTNNTINIIIYK